MISSRCFENEMTPSVESPFTDGRIAVQAMPSFFRAKQRDWPEGYFHGSTVSPQPLN
jgi:hypothetical protein